MNINIITINAKDKVLVERNVTPGTKIKLTRQQSFKIMQEVTKDNTKVKKSHD